MRILYWTELFWPHIGGVEVFSKQLLPLIVARGHEIEVICSHSGAKLPDTVALDGYTLHRFHMQRALAERDLLSIKRISAQISALKQRFKPEIIHINTCQPSIFFHATTRKSIASPVLVSLHEPISPTSGDESQTLRMLQSATWVTAVSRATLQSAVQLLPSLRDNSSIIYNGLEQPELTPQPVSSAQHTIVCIGRMIEDKGFDLALQALKIILAKLPNTNMILAGDGPAKFSLQALAREYGLQAHTRFTGWIDPVEIPSLINSASLVVVPSRWEEPYGLVALQAAQMCRPAVVADTGGLPEVVEHGVTGFCVPRENPQALAERTVQLLQDRSLATKMGQAGRHKAMRDFGLHCCTDQYHRLYLEMAAGRRAFTV